MTRPVSLIVMAPCSYLTANESGGWSVRYRRVKAWRHAARRAAEAAGLGPLPYPCRVVATVHRSHNRGRWDASNWSPTAKAVLDGLVDAGLLPDDSNRYVTGPDMRAGDGWADAGIVLTFTLDTTAPDPEPAPALATDPLWT